MERYDLVVIGGGTAGLVAAGRAPTVDGLGLENALFPLKRKAGYHFVPWTTFTDPAVARVGLTEEEAREKHGRVKAFRHDFPDIDRAICDGETRGFIKIVTGKGGRILGGHIIGPEAGNYVGELVLAMRKNIPVGELSQTVHVYPTLAQANQRAADNYYRQKFFTERNRKVLSAFFRVRRLLASNQVL